MTPPGRTLVFRLPPPAYLAVLFLLFCAAPLGLAADGGDQAPPVAFTWRIVVFLIPILAAVFIARTATFVSPRGLRVRALIGSRDLPWEQLRGLSITGRAVYAVLPDGAVRLPCVRTSDLAAIAKASDGRLPEIAEPVRKYAPSRGRRRVTRRQ